MNKLITIISILLIATSAHAETFTVERVIDGNTLKLTNGETVRLIGIDTPESKANKKAMKDAKRTEQDIETITKMGEEATEFLKNLFEETDAANIQLEFDVQERDKYGRLLAYVYYEPWPYIYLMDIYQFKDHYELETRKDDEDLLQPFIFLNATIIKAGYASPMTIPPNVKHAEKFVELYVEARENGRGLWEDEPSPKQVVGTKDKKSFYNDSEELILEIFIDGYNDFFHGRIIKIEGPKKMHKYTGTYEGYYPNKVLKFESNWLDGQLIGESKIFYKEGQHHMILNYEEGWLNNIREYDKEGQLINERNLDVRGGKKTREWFGGDKPTTMAYDYKEEPPMEISPFAAWDFNSDGKCDEKDLETLNKLVGECGNRTTAGVLADIDGDGCITEYDRDVILNAECWKVDTYYEK